MHLQLIRSFIINFQFGPHFFNYLKVSEQHCVNKAKYR
jgi:hypothetical protein